MSAALAIAGLGKAFRGRPAVDDLTVTVPRGEIVGFLGPNGAGKTTVMNMVMGLVAPDRGTIERLGVGGRHVPRHVRLRIGYLQEKPRIYPEMTARAYLTFFARLYGVPDAAARVGAVLDAVALTAAADRRLGAFSRGMQQRACLARVLLHRPELLILDEPTLGLDPEGVAQMRDVFRALRETGTTLLFSSHQLNELERVCDSVIFLARGRLVAQGRPAELLASEGPGGALSVELHQRVAPVLARLRALPLVLAARETGTFGADVVLAADAPADPRERRAILSRALTEAGLTPLSVTAQTLTLEDLFLRLARRGPTEGGTAWTSATPASAVSSPPPPEASASQSRGRWRRRAARSS